MSFDPLTVNDDTFIHVGPGKYMLNSVTFGQPLNYLLINGGKSNGKTGVTTASIARNIEKDVVNAEGGSSRKMLSVQVILSVPQGFTTPGVDGALKSVSDFITADVLERMLQGEQ